MHLSTGAWREEVMRKGGEGARSVRTMCDVCAAHGDRAAVGGDVDTQAFGKLRPTFPNARLECCTFVSKESWLVSAGTPMRWFYSSARDGR